MSEKAVSTEKSVSVTKSQQMQHDTNSKDSESQVDRGWAWVIVFASFIIQFIGDGVPYAFGLFFVEISKEFSSYGKSDVSWIASIMIAVTHGVGPFGSILVNKFGCRNVSILGSVLATIGYSTSYYATNVPVLYVTLGIVAGTGFGLMYLPAMVILPQYFNKKRAFATGIAVCGSGLGTFAFEWIFDFVLMNLNWREGLLVGSGIIFSSVFFALFYRSGPKQVTESETGTGKDLPDVEEKKSTKIIDLSLLNNAVFLIFSFCDLLTSIGFQVPYLYLPEIEKHQHNSTHSTMLGIIGISNVVIRLLFGYLSDKRGVNRLYVYIFALFIAGVGTIVISHLTTIWWLRTYAALYGGCMGVYISLKTVILVDLIGFERITDAFGIMLLIQSVGFVIGPPIVGKLYDIYGIYKPGFYFSGAMIAASALILFLIPIIQKRMNKKTEVK